MESRPSKVRWSELIQVGVRAASQIKVRFSRLARKLCCIRLASLKLGLWDVSFAKDCVVGMVKSPPITDRLTGPAKPGKGLEGACAFHRFWRAGSLAMTALCSRRSSTGNARGAQLAVKRRSTGK